MSGIQMASESKYSSLDEPFYDLDLRTDPRVQWIKDRILTYIGMRDEDLFYNMMEEGDAKQKFTTFIKAPVLPNELSLDKKTFYVSKIIVDKLIHEDKEFTEWSKLFETNNHYTLLKRVFLRPYVPLCVEIFKTI